MKNIITIVLLVFATTIATAQVSENTAVIKKLKNAKYEIAVNGNCDLCKKRIEKAAFTVSGVKSAGWDVDSQMLSLLINEDKTSATEVEVAVAKAGHDTKNVKATADAYSNLHNCCQYKRL